MTGQGPRSDYVERVLDAITASAADRGMTRDELFVKAGLPAGAARAASERPDLLGLATIDKLATALDVYWVDLMTP